MQYRTLAVTALAGGTRVLVAAPAEAGRHVRVYALFLQSAADGGAIRLQDSNGNNMTGLQGGDGNDGFVLPHTGRIESPWFRCAPDTAFQAVVGAAGDWHGTVLYAIG